MARNKNPQGIADNWANRMAGAGQAYAEGVRGVSTAPNELAAQAKDRYASGVQEAIASGRFERGNRAVTLNMWQDAAINKGQARLGTGAAQAKGKFASFMGRLIPFQDNLVAQLPARGTTDQNIQRAVAFMQGMSKFKNSNG